MDKIEILIEEKKSLREEILSINKTIYGTLFSAITIFGVTYGYFLSSNKLEHILSSKEFLLYSCVLSQVEFILAILIFSLSSSINTINLSLCIIDEKINKGLNTDLLFWSKKSRKFFDSFAGLQFVGTFIITILFTLLFLFFIYITFYWLYHHSKTILWFVLIIQILEFIISVIFIYLKSKEENKVIQYFQSG